MSALADAVAALTAAIETVEELRVFPLGAEVTPPAAAIDAPPLTGATHCPGPTTATFSVFVAVQLDDRALEALYDLVPAVWLAIENETDAVVTRAEPGVYSSGGAAALPAYQLTVEYPL